MMFRALFKCFLLCFLFLLNNLAHGFFLQELNDFPMIHITSNPELFHEAIEGRNRVFISFGGPTDSYHHFVNTICEKAVALGFFTHILGFSEADLKKDSGFWHKHGEFIESNPRGYGYWMWKPYLINLVLSHLNEDDVLIYADAGSTINPEGWPLLQEYINRLDNSDLGVLGYQLPHSERRYNKKNYRMCYAYTKTTWILARYRQL